jgi:hypothetical protein
VGPIAQSVEQRTFNPWVDGSSPSGPTSRFNSERKLYFEDEALYRYEIRNLGFTKFPA